MLNDTPKMSGLPQYRREPEESDTTPLFKSYAGAESDPSAAHLQAVQGQSSTSYPPVIAAPDLDDGGPARKSIIYTFVPRYPIRGSEENATGVLGRTKEVCTL